MATAEFIQKRIDGKLKEIATLEKKIARIEKAKATNWEKNPYYYSESDLEYALKDKAAAEAGLEDYKRQLEEVNNKAASRNVPAITEFLNQWELKVTEWLLSERDKFLEAQQEYYAKDHELTDAWNNAHGDNWREEKNRISAEKKKLKDNFHTKWSHILQFNHGSDTWENTMLRDIAIEKDRKYDDLLNRVIAITGPITDASGLYVGLKGDLDGDVIGEKGVAHVQTIGAGGYNEHVILDSGRHGQRYHYRTLVNKVR